LSAIAILRQSTDGPTDLAYYVLVMAELVIEILIALPVVLLWLTVVSVLVRPFGVRLPLTPFSWDKQRSAFQSLTFSQYVIVGGVLYFGCGMWIVTTLWRYLEWKYWHGPSISTENFLRDAMQYPLLSGFSSV
jgi:hypothetical protein